MTRKRTTYLVLPVIGGIFLGVMLLVITASFSPGMANPILGEAGQIEKQYSGLTDSPVITIGVAADLSGDNSILGWQEANSVQLAISQTNAAGGIDIGGITYTLSLVVADSPCGDNGQAIIAANTLLNSGAKAVVGHSCSGTSLAAQPVYNAAGVAMISPSSTNPQVTQQGYNTTFRTVTQDGTSPAMLAAYYRNREGFERSAIVETPDTPWGTQMGDVYSDTFTSLGGMITSRRFANTPGDFPAILSAIMSEDPDVVVYLDADPNEGGQFSLTAYELGMTDVIIGWIPWVNDESLLTTYATTAGTAAAENDIAIMQDRRFQDMPGWADFLAGYQSADFPNEPDNPGLYGVYAYDAARIIFAAIDRADSTDPAAIRNQVAATSNYAGVIGTYRGFDTNGDAIPQWAWLEQYQGGQWNILQPASLEIYSNNSGQRDLNALLSVYASTYPNVDVTIGTDYGELDDRIRSGNPPDGFEYHCGAQLTYTYIEPGDFIQPVTQLWTDQGWMDKFPAGLIDMLRYNEEFYCVPLNIHRGNVIWYNMQVFSDAGITPPTTFDEFFAAAEAISDTGKIPLALGDIGPWADTHLMETVLLGVLGPENYRGLWDGTTPFNGPEVEQALATFNHMLDYVNADHASLKSWQAEQLVADGQAGMTIMGDWAEGDFTSWGKIPGVDYGWVPVPGTNGSFMVINDSYIMPRNPPNFDEASNWLKTVGSVEGQEAYSLLKPALPARLDADPNLYDIYFQSAMADYASDELTPSLRHGMAAPPSFMEASDMILQAFIATGDVQSTATAWQIAACQAGFGKCFVFLPITVR